MDSSTPNAEDRHHQLEQIEARLVEDDPQLAVCFSRWRLRDEPEGSPGAVGATLTALVLLLGVIVWAAGPLIGGLLAVGGTLAWWAWHARRNGAPASLPVEQAQGDDAFWFRYPPVRPYPHWLGWWP